MKLRPSKGSRQRTDHGNHRLQTAAVAVAAATATALVTGTVASADGSSQPSTRSAPAQHKAAHARKPANLGLVKNDIKAYYGDTVVNGEHYPSADSAYAADTYAVQRRAKRYLTIRTAGANRHRKAPALVLDVDDTTLQTYNYELENDFGYNPVTNDTYVRAEKMPAVFGMPTLVNWAAKRGITVFFVTGRPEAQRDATQGNLAKAGYTPVADAAHLFLKNAANPPAYLPCGATCTTIEYKSLTRKHIEALGYDVIADLGDQQSDLSGGFTDATFKLPNPMYYLP